MNRKFLLIKDLPYMKSGAIFERRRVEKDDARIYYFSPLKDHIYPGYWFKETEILDCPDFFQEIIEK